MHDLGTILRDIVSKRREAWATAVGEYAPAEPFTPACELCQDRRFVKAGDGVVRCPQCGPAKEAERLTRMRGQLPDELRAKTFASLDPRRDLTPEQTEQFVSACRAASSFAAGTLPEPWLFFAGPPGVGKTHLEVCICNWRIENPEAGPPAAFVNAPDFLATLRAGFSNGTYESEMEAYKRVPLLVVDDIGAEKETEWASEQMYRLLNHRHMNGLATVLSTNVAIERVPERLADRMLDERTGMVKVCKLNVPSYRSGRHWA